jgi:hypothetical protein
MYFTLATHKNWSVSVPVCVCYLSIHSCSDLFLPTHCRWRGLLLHLITTSDTHTHTHTHNQYGSSRRVISRSHRPLTTPTQTDIHVPGWIRTRNHSKRAAIDLCFRPRGHRDRHVVYYHSIYVWVFQPLHHFLPHPCRHLIQLLTGLAPCNFQTFPIPDTLKSHPPSSSSSTG